MVLGAQLYTVRDFTKTLDDFAKTLTKVADIGYKTVQVSGTCHYDADWLNEQLHKNGLECVITHYSIDEMIKNPLDVVKKHKTFGCRYIGIGSLPGGVTQYNKFSEELKPVADVFAEQGCLLMYHNHDFEFIKDNLLDRLTNDFPTDKLGFTLDTYWVQAGGGDPAFWINKLKGRVPCIHLKDMAFDNGIKMAPIYEGNMNFDAILEACKNAGTEYLLIEQDDCYGENPFDCLALSYENLKKRGFN